MADGFRTVFRTAVGVTAAMMRMAGTVPVHFVENLQQKQNNNRQKGPQSASSDMISAQKVTLPGGSEVLASGFALRFSLQKYSFTAGKCK